MRRAFRLHRPGALVWLFLAAALFMRAVMPNGYMVERSGGSIVVDICNSDATWRIPLKQGDAAKDHGKPAPCAFAGLAGAALPAPDAPAIASLVAAETVQPRLAGKALATAPPRILPPARGPPLSA